MFRRKSDLPPQGTSKDLDALTASGKFSPPPKSSGPKTAPRPPALPDHPDLDERMVKRAMGYDPNDPNVTVTFIPMGGSMADALNRPFTTKDEQKPLGAAGIERLLNAVFPERVTAKDPDDEVIAEEICNAADEVMSDVADELLRAMEKFPAFKSAHEGYAIILEELDELWDEVKANTAYTEAGYKEAMQVAAMAVRFMVDLHKFRTHEVVNSNDE